MFIGHYAAGLACKRLAPRVSLGTLLMASVWIDLIWPVFVLLGIERINIVPGITKVTPLEFVYYPLSHSLAAVFIWAALFGAVYFILRRSALSSLTIFIAVISHWLLDSIVHIPDLPIGFGGEARVGLGLWNSIPGTIALEAGLFILGAAVYLRSTAALDKKGRYGIWVFLGLLALIYAGQFSGAVPPNEAVVALTGLSQWLFVISGYWVDRHRKIAGL